MTGSGSLAPSPRTSRRSGRPQLWSQAAGSPFWLGVLAGSQSDRPADHVIDLRLRYAAPDATELVALLTVAGRPATIDEIVRIEGWPEQRVQAALDELVSSGLATRTGRSVSLVHDLVRDAADQVSPRRRGGGSTAPGRRRSRSRRR